MLSSLSVEMQIFNPFPSPTAKHYLDYIGIIPVVIMEFVDGGCLRTFLNNFRRNVKPDSVAKKRADFLLYGKQIAEGMHYLVSCVAWW